MTIDPKYRRLALNAALGALAAGAAALAGPEGADILPDSWTSVPVVALVWASLRVGAGVLAAGLGKPIPVDTPPAPNPAADE